MDAKPQIITHIFIMTHTHTHKQFREAPMIRVSTHLFVNFLQKSEIESQIYWFCFILFNFAPLMLHPCIQVKYLPLSVRAMLTISMNLRLVTLGKGCQVNPREEFRAQISGSNSETKPPCCLRTPDIHSMSRSKSNHNDV